MKLEKFNLEKALNGFKVVTRDGREVTGLRKLEATKGYPLAGVLEGSIHSWRIDGSYFAPLAEYHADLFLFGSQVRRAWVNIYGNGRDILTSGCYRTKQAALHNIVEDYEYIKTIEITDEL